MRFLDIVRMSFQALGKNGVQTALTTLGVVIGVSAVIAMVSLGQGAQALVDEQMQSMGSNVLYVMPAGQRGPGGARLSSDESVALTVEDVEAIEREVPAVAAVTPVVYASGQLVSGNLNWSARVEGVNEQYLAIRDWPIEQGAFFSEDDVRTSARVIVIGQTVAENLLPGMDPIGQTVRIRNMPYLVVGVLSPKGNSVTGTDQDDTVLMPYTTVQKKMLGQTILSINRAMVSAISPAATQLAEEQIADLLRERHNIRLGGDDDFMINNLTDVAETAEQTNLIMTLLLGSVAAVSLIVGGIGIMNIMLVSVTERTREIGIRMAVGSRGSYIRMQFLAESVILCMFGGIVGILTGAGLSVGIAHLMNWPTLVSPEAAVISFVFAAGIGIFFGYYPAHKAASLEPIDALRYE